MGQICVGANSFHVCLSKLPKPLPRPISILKMAPPRHPHQILHSKGRPASQQAQVNMTGELADVQHCPICPLRSPLLTKPQDTLQAGILCFLAKNKGRRASTAACNQASRRVCGATASDVGDKMGVGPGATLVMTRPHQPSRPACFAHAAAGCHRQWHRRCHDRYHDQCRRQNLCPNHPKQAKYPNLPLAPAGS